MALKNMVNELVEIGFENASRALRFAGFIPQSNNGGQEFEDAKEFIGGLCIEEGIKDQLIDKCLAIEDGVMDRVVNSAEYNKQNKKSRNFNEIFDFRLSFFSSLSTFFIYLTDI